MAVDPQIPEILDFIASRNAPPLWELTPQEAREAMLKSRVVFVAEPPELPRVENRTIPGPAGELPLRIFANSVEGPLPILLFFHGGGWVIGDLDTHDDVCRRLAIHSGCLVVSVDYRLAPEHKYPAAVDDSLAALQWVAGHGAEIGGDPSRIAVGGDSAGGNLAAVVALLARDAGGPKIGYQMLVYPATAHDFDAPSMRENAEGYFLEVRMMHWFFDHYLPSAELSKHPQVSPLHAKSLAGLPPAFVITAQYDPLRDEGEAYAQRLKESGVPTELRRYDGLIHGFFTMTVTDASNRAIQEASAALKGALSA